MRKLLRKLKRKKAETYIREYLNILSKEECERIIKFFEESPDKKAGTVTSPDDSSSLIESPDIKVTIDVNTIYKNAELDKLIYDRISVVWADYMQYFSGYGFMEAYFHGLNDSGYQIQKSLKNIGKFNWHQDCALDISKPDLRHFSIIIYLNDVAKGGETEYFYQNRKIKPQTGKIIIVPAYPPWAHRGCVPISNDKYIINTFMYSEHSIYKSPEHKSYKTIT